MCGKMHRSDFLLGVIAVFLTLEEMKNYLRVDHEEDDGLLADLLKASERLCMDIARMEDQQEFEQSPNAKIAVQYAVAYQYEHREEADHHTLILTLRALLFGERKPGF
nr:head-tail connector protein [Blautia obeum]